MDSVFGDFSIWRPGERDTTIKTLELVLIGERFPTTASKMSGLDGPRWVTSPTALNLP